MANSNSPSRWWSVILLLVVIYGSIELHEAGHWLVLEWFDRGPTMGFAGLVQRWDAAPLHPEQWQKVYYPQLGTGWFRLKSLPQSNLEWALMLLAGQMVPLILILLGMGLHRRYGVQPWGTLGLMLVFVNGAMGLSKLIGLGMGNRGDLYFLSLHVPLNPTLLTLLFAILQLMGLAWAWQRLSSAQRLWWSVLLVVGYFLLITPLRIADGFLRQQINREAGWAQPLWGWSKPVLLVNGAILILLVLTALRHRPSTG